MNKLTPKQEAFAKAYIEIGNASEAYRRSYNAENMAAETIHVKAHEVLKNDKVAVRIKEIEEELNREFKFTIREAHSEYEEARRVAQGREDPNAMIRATDGKSRIHGLFKDKIEVDVNVSLADILQRRSKRKES